MMAFHIGPAGPAPAAGPERLYITELVCILTRVWYLLRYSCCMHTPTDTPPQHTHTYRPRKFEGSPEPPRRASPERTSPSALPGRPSSASHRRSGRSREI